MSTYYLRGASYSKASLVVQMVKNLPAIWETWVQSLGQEDFLEKGLATHSSILAWRIPWTEELDGLQSPKEWDTTEQLTHTGYIQLLRLPSLMLWPLLFSLYCK